MVKSSQYYELKAENDRLRSAMENINRDSISYSAMKFISKKGLLDEWTEFHLSLLDSAPPNNLTPKEE